MKRSAALAPILGLALMTDPTHAQPAPQRNKAMRFTASAYCQQGTTKSGTPARPGIVAADPRVLPIGTVLEVKQKDARRTRYLVADTGPAVKGRHIDIFMSNCAAAKRFGRRTVMARVTRAASAKGR